MANNDPDMDWEPSGIWNRTVSRRAPMYTAMSNAFPIRREFGHSQAQATIQFPTIEDMPPNTGSLQHERDVPMIGTPQIPSVRQQFAAPLPTTVESQTADLTSLAHVDWPAEALGILAVEKQASNLTELELPEAFSNNTGFAKRSAEDESQHDQPVTHQDFMHRVKAQIKRSKTDWAHKGEVSSEHKPSAPQMTLEDTYDRFWSNGRPQISTTIFDGEAALPEKSPYSGLPHNDSFRLLCLAPGKETPLSCHLVPQRLSQIEHSYEAISYVWGDLNTKVSLHVSTDTIGVTKNLHAFLQHLRLEDKPRYLWADAACVDQSSIAERNHQVSLMRQIYTKASSVAIWLGSDMKTKSKMAFSVICSIASGGTLNGRPLGQAHFYSNDISSANIPDIPCRDGPPNETFAVLWSHVQELFNQDWFWRIWCIQEVTLAKLANVHWGCCRIPWSTLGLAAARLRTGQLPVMRRYPMPGVFNAYFMYRVSASQGTSDYTGLNPLKLSFLKLLALTGQFGVTDPLDRVFGLLGMPTSDTRQHQEDTYVKPNYNLRPNQLYEVLAEKAVSLDQANGDCANLALLLASVQHQPRKDETSQSWLPCPSWVPQWGSHRAPLLMAWESPPLLRTRRPISTTFEPSLTLTIPGVVCDTIASIAEIASNPIATHGLEQYINTRHGRTVLGRTVLGMTLSAGKQWYGIPADMNEHLGDFEGYLRKHRGFYVADNDESVHRFTQAVQNAVSSRLLFSTQQSGQLGLGPDVAQVGDEIVLLEGAVTPFILRPFHSELLDLDGINHKRYQLVGECYIYGLVEAAMQAGKVIEELKIF